MLVRILVALLAAISIASAAELPAGAKLYLPLLVQKQRQIWPDAPIPSFLAAQIETESCITLKHSKCWNPRAELKTSRENGIGFGQFTRAYRADGSIRFDKISELASRHKSLKGWTWETRYDPNYQMTAFVEMDKAIYGRVSGAATPVDRVGFTLSAYNGGEAGVLQDRRLCANTRGCSPSKWFGHVEKTSLKSKVPQPGYGRSFFQINREYVAGIVFDRRTKYEPFFSADIGSSQ